MHARVANDRSFAYSQIRRLPAQQLFQPVADLWAGERRLVSRLGSDTAPLGSDTAPLGSDTSPQGVRASPQGVRTTAEII